MPIKQLSGAFKVHSTGPRDADEDQVSCAELVCNSSAIQLQNVHCTAGGGCAALL